MNDTYIVDVMANVRKIDVKNMKYFGELCQSFLSYVLNICRNADQIHFVFDSYRDGTVKDSERSRRYQSYPIDISIITDNTPIPVDMSSFWASNNNKQKFQSLLKKHISNMKEKSVILSAYMINDDIVPCCELHRTETIDDLNIEVEEADFLLLPHAKYAVENGTEKIIVLSNDTDVIVGFIYHCRNLLNNGLKELWLRGGVGVTTRFIPIHTLINNLGPSLCEQMPAMHCLTGHDANSKFGTKLSGLKQLTNAKLGSFGKDPRVHSVEEMIQAGEEYLVRVLKSSSSCKSMDDLRFDIYHHSKSHSFVDLPPTSFETRGHCLRGIYNTYQYLYAMVVKLMPVLDPREYAYEEIEELLVPSRYLRMYPEGLIEPCSCKACATSRCKCKAEGARCCVYCKCSGNINICKNTVNGS